MNTNIALAYGWQGSQHIHNQANIIDTLRMRRFSTEVSKIDHETT